MHYTFEIIMNQEIRHRNEEPCVSNLELIFNAGELCKHPAHNKLAYLKSCTNKRKSQKSRSSV